MPFAVMVFADCELPEWLIEGLNPDLLATPELTYLEVGLLVASQSEPARVLDCNELFPLPRAFEQRHAGFETGFGDGPTESTLLLI